MRLGLFGGSFDPVHLGHLLLAESCREGCQLDEVWFLPSAVPPHKQHRQTSPDEARLEMLELAVAAHPVFSVSRYETDRGGVNYTADTLAHCREQHPDAELFFLLGADMLNDLPAWRQPQRVCELATPIVVGRPGAGPIDFAALQRITSAERIAQIRSLQVQMPEIGISSTDIRGRVVAGRSIRYQVPRAVERYILAHGLYRSGSA
jgi:nicotinate-nucleotide adenylyltransferase